jgi:glutaminase
MPSAEISQQIDERLRALYRRYLPIEADSIASYYSSGRGYYAPALAGPERDHFGISLATVDGELHHVGDHELRFALQSLSKVFIYGLAPQDRGRERVSREVGVEPSGDAFNSIVFDERNNRPYNPMVNAGALVATNLVAGGDPAEKLPPNRPAIAHIRRRAQPNSRRTPPRRDLRDERAPLVCGARQRGGRRGRAPARPAPR